jgi:hypothetical protein
METTQTTSNPQTQPEAPSLQIADLVLVLRLIQATAQRGAIRAEEMADIGTLHNKLFQFLSAVGAIQPAQESKPTEENQNG